MGTGTDLGAVTDLATLVATKVELELVTMVTVAAQAVETAIAIALWRVVGAAMG